MMSFRRNRRRSPSAAGTFQRVGSGMLTEEASVNTTQLATLARTAIINCDARLVLADAIEESGWWDARLKFALSREGEDDKAECLALLLWPGETGAKMARAIAEALETSNEHNLEI
jgi:hypothetical protein